MSDDFRKQVAVAAVINSELREIKQYLTPEKT